MLIDIDDVALGHENRMRWNDPTAWIWSDRPVHPPLIDPADFRTAQDLLAAAGRRAVDRKPRRSPHEYTLTGLMFCGLCQRRMQGSWNNGKPHYRCVFAEQYALANRIDHPRSVYVREEIVLPPLDAWLATAFDPPQLTGTIRAMEQAQDLDDHLVTAASQARRTIADAAAKLARYRAALESGTDPALIATWTAEVTATKATAQATLRSMGGRQRMTEDDIATIVVAAGSILDVLRWADGRDKAAVYHQLGLRLTYQPDPKTLIAEAQPSAIMYETKCPRGVMNQIPMVAQTVDLQVPREAHRHSTPECLVRVWTGPGWAFREAQAIFSCSSPKSTMSLRVSPRAVM